MSVNPLLDGSLSIKIAGVEYAAVAGALQYESVGPGGFGAASFEVYPQPTPFSATGGVVTTDGLYTVHEFTADDTLVCAGGIEAEVLVVAGGGAGYGNGAPAVNSGDGGSAGELCHAIGVSLSGNVPIIVGDGGTGVVNAAGNDGGFSQCGDLVAEGGIGGQHGHNAVARPGGAGAGGGGGTGSGGYAGDGGPGLAYSIVDAATPVYYAGGGGGGFSHGGQGGIGGGGHGESYGNPAGTGGSAGAANTGGGGGGRSSAYPTSTAGFSGGKGVVVVRYPTSSGTPFSVLTDFPELVNEADVVVNHGTAGPFVNIIPTMTSATAPSGVASADSEISGGSPAWKAFDHVNPGGDENWISDTAGFPHWLAYEFPAAHVITQYAVTVRPDALAFPSAWTFEGYNGLTWDVLDTQSGVTSWTAGEKKTYPVTNSGSYTNIRLNFSAGQYTTHVAIGELEMMEGAPSTLYEGHIVGDPTIAKLENGESLITVECGGLLDEAKYRQDYGATAVDTTYDNWARHRLSDKGFTDTIDGMLRFDVNDGQIFTAGDIAGVFYRVNQGIVTSPDDTIQALDFEYDLALAAATWHCDIWAAPYYVDTLNSADWTTGLWHQSNSTAEGTAHVTLPAGTWRCIAFVNWVSGAGTSAAKRHAELTNLRVNCFDAGGATPTVDQAMVDCGVVTGLAVVSDTETIGNPLAQCMIPPSTTHADGMDKFASMYEAPVDWGFWDNATLRARKRLNSPADNVAIRALAGAGTAPAAYLLDAATPAIDYDVHQYEEGAFDYVRAIFTNSRTNRVATPSPSGSTWPADWYRDDAVKVTALSDRFKFALSGADCFLAALTPGSGQNAILTPDTYGIECRIPFTVTVPAGTTVKFWAIVGYYTNAGAFIGEQIIASRTVVGAATASDYVLQGAANVYPGVGEAVFTVAAQLMAGSGSTAVLFSPVDFHDVFPGGMVRTVCAPSEPPADADVKVGILDLTDRGDLTVDRAFAVATQALAWIDSTLETGTIAVFSPTVPTHSGGEKNAAYIRASDWVECIQVDGHSPLWISSSHVDVDAGQTTLTIEPYPFDVAESDFGHAHMQALRRWRKARSGMYRAQKAALRKAQARENKTKLGSGHKRRIHYI